MFESLIPAEWVMGVRQMEAPEFWMVALLLLALTGAAFYGVFRFFHRARLIEDIPTSKIRSAAQGYVELDGTAELMEGEPIVAPLTGTRCTWYSYKVEEKVEHYSSKGRRTSWKTIQSGVSDELFLIVDETGECVIDPEGAEVTPSKSDTWYGNSPAWTHGLPGNRGNRFFSTGRYRYTEKRIHVADSLYAIGMFRTVGGSQELPNTRDDVRNLLNVWKRDQAALLKHFDKNGDGHIDTQEWELVRATARKVVLKDQAERFHRPVHHIMSRPDSSRQPYLLSVLPQHQLVQRLKLYAGLSLFGFIGMGAMATWMLTVRLAG